MRHGLITAWFVVLTASSLTLVAQTTREREMAQCLPGEMVTWGDGLDRPAIRVPLVFAYVHQGAPEWLSEQVVMRTVRQAVFSWASCGVPSRVMAVGPETLPPEGSVLIQWSDAISGANVAQADLGKGLLVLNSTVFRLLNTRKPGQDAGDVLQMVISHEMGHHFGLVAHSRRCVDVTSYYDNGKGERCFTRDGSLPRPGFEYRATLPTACDIARCIQANSAKP